MSGGWQIFSDWVAGKLTTQGASTARTDAALRALAAARRFSSKGPANQSFADSVLTGLDARLRSFERAVSGFSWPDAANPFLTGRLAAPSNSAHPGLSMSLKDGANAKSPLRYFSKGFNAAQKTSLDPGSYTFDLAQAGKTERLSVAVTAKDTWGEVLKKTAAAINGSELFAQGAAVYSNAPAAYDPQVTATGSILAVKLDPARAALGDVSLTDVSGGLLSALSLAKSRQLQGPASVGPHSAQVRQTASATRFTSKAFDERAATTLAVGTYDFAVAVNGRDNPTTYFSKTLDPTAASTLAAGTHSFSMKVDGETRNISFDVASGATNGQVLSDAWRALRTYLPAGASVDLESANIPSSVQYASPTAGERLKVGASAGTEISLTDGATGVLAALGLDTPLVGTPVSVEVWAGDRWKEVLQGASQAVASADAGYFSAELGDRAVTDRATVAGQALSTAGLGLSIGIKDPKEGQALRLSDGAGGMLAALGLTSATGGVDAKTVIDGREESSATGTFAKDSGRIGFQATAQTAPLQLSVVDALSGLEDALGDLAASYNALKAFLNSNLDRISPSVAKGLDAPLDRLSGRLAKLGVYRMDGGGKLVVDGSSFASTLYRDGTGSRLTFFDEEGGLIPSWTRYAASLREQGLENVVKGASGPLPGSWRPETENDLHKTARVLNLIG